MSKNNPKSTLNPNQETASKNQIPIKNQQKINITNFVPERPIQPEPIYQYFDIKHMVQKDKERFQASNSLIKDQEQLIIDYLKENLKRFNNVCSILKLKELQLDEKINITDIDIAENIFDLEELYGAHLFAAKANSLWLLNALRNTKDSNLAYIYFSLADNVQNLIKTKQLCFDAIYGNNITLEATKAHIAQLSKLDESLQSKTRINENVLNKVAKLAQIFSLHQNWKKDLEDKLLSIKEVVNKMVNNINKDQEKLSKEPKYHDDINTKTIDNQNQQIFDGKIDKIYGKIRKLNARCEGLHDLILKYKDIAIGKIYELKSKLNFNKQPLNTINKENTNNQEEAQESDENDDILEQEEEEEDIEEEEDSSPFKSDSEQDSRFNDSRMSSDG